MWGEMVFKKIFRKRTESLRDYFDDLSLENVIPQLLQYVFEHSRGENAIWLTRDEFVRLHDQRTKTAGADQEQLLYRHLKLQGLQPVSEETMTNAVGVFSADSRLPQKYLCEDKVDLLLPILHVQKHDILAYVLVRGVPVARAHRVEVAMSRDLAQMAKHIGFSLQYWISEKRTFVDDLTGLYNQKYMQLVLEGEINRAQRENLNFAVLFMDVDFFKSINDQKGHWVGSRLLVEIGHLLRANVRKSDYAFRYGGDEFVVVLPFADAIKAHNAAERLRSVIEKSDFMIDGEHIRLTLSIGIATYPQHAKTYKDILKMADEAMYCGKHKSRNIVFVAS